MARIVSQTYTVHQYKQIGRQHILPVMGHMRLLDVHSAHIKQLYALKKQKGKDARTAQLIQLLSTMHSSRL